MSSFLDALVWLVDLPVRHGPVFVFLGIFGGLGALALFAATGTEKGRPLPGSIITNRALVDEARPLLAAARAREGLPRAAPPAPRPPSIARVFAGALLAAVLAGGILGFLGLAGVPVARAYIYDHGVEIEARMDGRWVSFTASDGAAYTLGYDFFPSSAYPGSDPPMGDDQDVIRVRYLAGHPQAFVVVVEDLS